MQGGQGLYMVLFPKFFTGFGPFGRRQNHGMLAVLMSSIKITAAGPQWLSAGRDLSLDVAE